MRGRGAGRPPPSDILVCFPTRTQITHMPRSSGSPAHPHDTNGRRIHRKKKSRLLGSRSPILWAKSKGAILEAAEPASPKVTCAGQIKIRPHPMVEGIDKIRVRHSIRAGRRKKHTWVEALGLKKEMVQFFSCFRCIRFRCFRSFGESEISEDEEEEVCGSAFSKWFMHIDKWKEAEEGSHVDEVPPGNALLLMRCVSAPPKTWGDEGRCRRWVSLLEMAEKGEEVEDNETATFEALHCLPRSHSCNL